MSIQEAYLQKIIQREQNLELQAQELETEAGRLAREAETNWNQLHEARKLQRELQREIASLDGRQFNVVSAVKGDIENVRIALDYSTTYFKAYFK